MINLKSKSKVELINILNKLQKENDSLKVFKHPKNIISDKLELYKSIFFEAPIGIEYYNSEGYLIDTNQKCLDIFGVLNVNEIKGFNLFEDPNLSEDVKNLIKDGHSYNYDSEFDFELVKKNNLYKTSKSEKCHLHILITPYEVPFTNKKSYLVLVEDITTRKLAEINSKKNQYYLEKSQEMGVIGTWELDIKKNILIWTDETYKIFDVELGTKMNLEFFLNCIHPDDKEFVLKIWNKALIDGNYDIRHRILANNNVKWVRQKAIIKYDRDGSPMSAIGFAQDITDRKNIEKKLKSSINKAQESDRLKSEFLANMSHEIRTPMNGILGFSNLLKDVNISSSEQKKYISIIEKSGERMLNIINDLIDISKVESGQMKIINSETNINEQIEYVYTFFKPEVERKGMKLSFKTPLSTKDSIINTGREKIYAVLTNLVKNAIKYSEIGSIELGYRKINNYLEFYVKDTGIGVPKGSQQTIFNRFIRGNPNEERVIEGAGLGLSISKAFVEMLGGKIWVDSEEGIGSCFYFTIPYNINCNELTKTLDYEQTSKKEYPLKKLKILIAEDEDISDLYLTLILENLECEILHAKTGVEAIDICYKNLDIDLILMDIRMPEMNGYLATKKIRTFNKNVVIIAQTAFGLNRNRIKALEIGCDEYISKPINQDLLMQLIGKHFKR